MRKRIFFLKKDWLRLTPITAVKLNPFTLFLFQNPNVNTNRMCFNYIGICIHRHFYILFVLTLLHSSSSLRPSQSKCYFFFWWIRTHAYVFTKKKKNISYLWSMTSWQLNHLSNYGSKYHTCKIWSFISRLMHAMPTWRRSLQRVQKLK